LKLLPCKIPKEAETLGLPIKTSVLQYLCPKLEDEERLSRKLIGKESKTTQCLWLDVKDVSSWKGPELERVSKVRLSLRGSELTLEPGRGLQMPFCL
jgi:hypothetical protein